MAITITAPISSTIAKAVKNIFSPNGTRLPNNVKIPRVKAISVAIGIPQPSEPTLSDPKNKNINTGNSIPPIAANIGNEALRSVVSSPTKISLLTSNPITKKKTAIKPSLIHKINGFDK